MSYNKTNLLELFHKRAVEITFLKANNEIRLLRGTLRSDLLPEAIREQEPSSNDEKHPTLLTVWDLDVQDWRSFHSDRVQSVI